MLQRRGTASQWTSANTVLAAGEIGVETDTGQFKIGDGTTAWSSIPYFKDTLDLDISGKAPLVSPTFTGNVTLPSTTSIGDVSSTELAYVNGVTSAIQTQLDGKLASATASTTYAPLSGPSFTGTVTLPNTTSIGDVSSTEIGYVNGVTSAIQTQLDAKAPLASPTFTGTVSGVTATHVGLGNVDNTTDANKPVSTATQTALDLKANIASPTFTGTVTLAQAPTSDLHATTKLYVDNVAAGINFHEAVHAASVNNLAVVYDNGTSGVGATLTADTNRAFSTLDGESVVVGQRVLIKNQTDAKQNGIYVLTTNGSVSVPWVLTRATDADNSPVGEMKAGDFCFVTNGTTNAGFGFVNNSTANPIVIGTDNITYTGFNAATPITAGNGLQEATPGILSIDTTITQARVANVSDTEIGYLDGVTSAIQTQLDTKAPLANPTFTGTVSLPNDTITASMIAANAITTAKITDLNVTTAKIADLNVTTGKIADLGVTTGKIADSAVTDAKVATGIAQSKITNLVTDLAGKFPSLVTLSQQTASYTLVLADRDKMVEVLNAGATTLSIPTDASVAFPVGTRIELLQTGAGQVTVAAVTPGTTTVNGTPGLKLRAQWSSAMLIKRAANTWVLIGDLVA